MSHVEQLSAVRALIEDPAHWTRGEMARNINGIPVDPCSPFAVCWCVEGAIKRVCDLPAATDVYRAPIWYTVVDAAYLNHGTRVVWQANDDNDHAAALALIDKAIILGQVRV